MGKINRKSLGVALGAILLSASLLNSKPAAACSSDPLLGSVCIFAGNFAIRGYAFTHGQLLPINSNTALFSLLGTMYGGDGRTTFGLPDTRSRVVVGEGQGPGLSRYAEGQKGGVEQVTLSTSQLPSHTHAANTAVTVDVTTHASSADGTTASSAGNVWGSTSRDRDFSTAAPDVDMSSAAVTANAAATTSVDNAGGSQAHENRMPYIAMHYLIALQGVFPSRN